MSTILDRIILEKQKEVKKLKESYSISSSENIKTYSLIDHLEKANNLAVIAEFKRASPSKGDINIHLDPAKQAKLYEQNGAAAISVLTDTTFFKGSFHDLMVVREAVDIPILCKDFIIDPIQIDLAKESGANIILLIAAALTTTELANLYEYANLKNLEVLMEIHDEEELEKALKIGPNLFGINNRDLKTFEVDLGVTERLTPLIKSYGGFVISESGIFTRDDAEKVSHVGVDGILVGESLMRSQDLASHLQSLMVPSLRGLRVEG